MRNQTKHICASARTIGKGSGYRLSNYIGSLIILTIGLIIYSNSFHAPFQYDDFRFITENDNIKDLGNISRVWHAFARRKITALSFALNYHFFGSSVLAYHLVNVSIHIASAILVYVLVQLIFKTPEMQKDILRRQARLVSLTASLIFLCHPVQTNAVTYIWQRTASQATLFYLLAVTLYLAGRLKGRPWYFIGAFFSMILAILSKENTVTIPLMFIACELCFFGLCKRRKRLLLLAGICILIVLAVIPLYYILAKHVSHDGSKHAFTLPRDGTLPRGVYFLTELNVLRTYLRLLLFPVHLSFDYDYPISRTLFEARTLLSGSLLLALFGLAVRLFRRHRLMAFGILWFFVTLSPESSIIPINDVIVEYRLYLAMTGFAVFIATLLYHLIRSPRMLWIATGLITLLLGSMTYNRNSIWANDLTLWQDAVQKSPTKARARLNLGYAYLQRGEYDKAIEQDQLALRMQSTYSLAWYNMALAYGLKGEYEESIECYLRDLECDPSNHHAYYNLGITYSKIGQMDKAIEYFRTAIRYRYDHVNSHYNLAVTYIKTGDYEAANKEIDILRKLGNADAADKLRSTMNRNVK